MEDSRLVAAATSFEPEASPSRDLAPIQYVYRLTHTHTHIILKVDTCARRSILDHGT